MLQLTDGMVMADFGADVVQIFQRHDRASSC
jgi:hypothetical protein